MGGSGSGGWNHSGRATVEQTAKLGIAALQKARAFRPGAYTVWRWSVGERQCASIGVHGEHDAIRLSYNVSTEDQPHRVDERVALQRRPCPFGGERRLFCCPRCARAALNLHLRGGRFVCRVCARLTYASRRERERDRHLRAANKLRRRLGSEEGCLNAIGERPKGMWRRTYARILDKIERREGFAHEELAGWVMKLGARSQRPAAKGFWR